MSSTSNAHELEVDAFFFQVLVPLAKGLHARKDALYFRRAPDPSQDTYFVKRKKAEMAAEDFEAGACNSPEDLRKALQRLWAAEGNAALAVMAPAIADLANSAHYTEEEGSEVSPFIYVMF